MSGIVAVGRSGETGLAAKALEKIHHRGPGGPVIFDIDSVTHGEVRNGGQRSHTGHLGHRGVVLDGAVYNWATLYPQASSAHHALQSLFFEHGPEFVKLLDGPFAFVIAGNGGLSAARDMLGVAPLYQGMYEGVPCYASEIKALLGWAEDVCEFPPGHYCTPEQGLVCYSRLEKQEPMRISGEDAAVELRRRLEQSVEKRISAGGEVGVWLSGGLDSSVLAALAALRIPRVKTFSVGLPGAPDLDCAVLMARHVGATHHQIEVTLGGMMEALRKVIYHLESFDALLVRSSIMNYLVGKLASAHVDSVFSGEGGDELFAGYGYLKELPATSLADELVDITNRLHNTALQRVDRCSSAHGLRVHTGFLDRDVVDLALRIPHQYKLRTNGDAVEKWILRRAMYDLLPDEIANRRKSKFWEGSGVENMLEEHAASLISDTEFARERRLPDGSLLNTKEELMYYRIFREHFGDLDDLSFVGRTKGAPTAPLSHTCS